MYCLAMFDSSNYAVSICNMLERKGFVFDIVSIPCKIAKGGCGYCLRFPEQYKNIVVTEGINNNMPVREMYIVKPNSDKLKYEKVDL